MCSSTPGDSTARHRSAECHLQDRGFTVLPGAVSRTERDEISRKLDEIAAARSGSRDIEPSNGIVARLLAARPLRGLLEGLLGLQAKPVRVIYFDKTDRRNWAVPWHQDRIIAVDRQVETAQVSGWTLKNGIPHCEAPASLLERMLILRWHLDRAGECDGGLRVLPGSHTLGRLTQARIKELRQEVDPQDIEVSAGGFLIMRPLLVHSSPVRRTAGRRRVLHIELAAGSPPAPLGWAWG